VGESTSPFDALSLGALHGSGVFTDVIAVLANGSGSANSSQVSHPSSVGPFISEDSQFVHSEGVSYSSSTGEDSHSAGASSTPSGKGGRSSFYKIDVV